MWWLYFMRQRLLYSIWQTFHFNVCSQFLFMCNDFVLPKKKYCINLTKYWQMPRKLKKMWWIFPPELLSWYSVNSLFSCEFRAMVFFRDFFFLLAFHVWREYYFAFALSHDLEFGVWSENEFFKHLICLANYMIWRMSVYILYTYSL